MLSKFIIEQTEVEKLFNDIFLSDEAPEVDINYVDLHTVMIVSTLRYAIRYKLDYIANKDIAYMLNYVKKCVQLISSLKIVLINFRVNDKLVLRMQRLFQDQKIPNMHHCRSAQTEGVSFCLKEQQFWYLKNMSMQKQEVQR